MNAVFVDTMGWFSLLNRRDNFHGRAVRLMEELRAQRTPLLTSDYVADETATLLKVRGANASIDAFFEVLDRSGSLMLTFIDLDRFRDSQRFFRKHKDHGYSFTDVSSFVVMRELSIHRAFTHDAHFREAGFEVLL